MVPSPDRRGNSALDRRLPLVVLPTPLEPADRLGAALGMDPGALWVKRDDVTGLGGGGNKARKLSYLCADALAQGADVLVTGGGPQSNHVRMTAAAANRLGLDCAVVIAGPRPAVATGNVLLVELLGPQVIWTGPADAPLDYDAVQAAIDEAADRLEAEGRRPYYGAPTEECREALLLAARSEGLVLDPVYTGKALAGLVAARRDGSVGPSARTVFVHTGGVPALFTGPYSAWGRDS